MRFVVIIDKSTQSIIEFILCANTSDCPETGLIIYRAGSLCFPFQYRSSVYKEIFQKVYPRRYGNADKREPLIVASDIYI